MCLDYRKVNTHLVTDIHPLPHLEELVENVAGNKLYATLDLKDAYYQVMLDEESRDLTTFTEGTNLCRFKRLPFGLSCSASVFVRQLQGALAPLFKPLRSSYGDGPQLSRDAVIISEVMNFPDVCFQFS